MFRPNCSAIFRLVFESVQCRIDNVFNLRDLVLQDLVKIIAICYVKNVILKFEYATLYETQ